MGSPRLIVDTATGAIAQRIDYDEFGKVTLETNPGFQPFGFAGGLYEQDTGLVRFGARDYDAKTGRWTAKDQSLFEGDDPNLYVYVGGNPVSMLDPHGLWSIADTPDIPPEIVDFSAGLGDGLLLGTGGFLRELVGATGVVNDCSNAYEYGGLAAFAFGAGRLAYAGLAKAGSVLAASGGEAVAFRTSLKTFFRGGIGRNWRPPNLAGKTDAQLRASAGKTNFLVNAYGAGVGTAGGMGAAKCACAK